MARIFITGGTGFIGSALVHALTARGDECLVLSRGTGNPWPELSVQMVRGNPAIAGAWEKLVDGCDAVINLAGERIVSPPLRWTDERKHRLRTSRINGTHNVVTAIRVAEKPPRTFLSGSAVGYYGDRGDETLDESAPPGNDFLAQLCVDWEAAAMEAADRTSVTLLRSGVVMGKGGGGLAPLMWLFKMGLGGPWGDAHRWWSWIHLDDHVALMIFLLDRQVPGPVNLTAPEPVTLEHLSRAMGHALHRPTLLHAPEFALRLALGEAADPLLHLQRVIPKRAIEAGFGFRHPTIESALAAIAAD